MALVQSRAQAGPQKKKRNEWGFLQSLGSSGAFFSLPVLGDTSEMVRQHLSFRRACEMASSTRQHGRPRKMQVVMVKPRKEQPKCQQRDVLVTSAPYGLVSDPITQHLPQE